MSHEPSDFLCWKPSSQPSANQTSVGKVVHTALRALSNYWDDFFELYDSSALPTKPTLPLWVPCGPFWVPSDMLTGKFLGKQRSTRSWQSLWTVQTGTALASMSRAARAVH